MVKTDFRSPGQCARLGPSPRPFRLTTEAIRGPGEHRQESRQKIKPGRQT
jgi:hypothetical protein